MNNDTLKIKYRNIANDYLNGMTVKEIAKKYNYKYPNAIFPILKKMGVERKTRVWTKEMIEFLKENYSKADWNVLLDKLKPFTKEEIIHKASKLNLKRENFFYSPEEISILIKNYNKMSVRELKEKYLPHRSEYSIMVKANKLGLVSREKWSIDEINLLIDVYEQYSNEELVDKFFPNRTVKAIQSQAEILGLKKNYSLKEYTEEELIELLKKYAEELGRTPLGCELLHNNRYPSLSTYHRYFGSYTNACKEAGLELNPNIISGICDPYTSSNNDICYSKAELIITEALIANNIPYKKEYFYRDIINDQRCGKKRCDWFVDGKIIVEYFGMPTKDYYKKKMEEKRSICVENNIPLIEIFEKDLSDISSIINKINSHRMVTVTTVGPISSEK